MTVIQAALKFTQKYDWSHEPHWPKQVDLCSHLPPQSSVLANEISGKKFYLRGEKYF